MVCKGTCIKNKTKRIKVKTKTNDTINPENLRCYFFILTTNIFSHNMVKYNIIFIIKNGNY